MRIVQFAVSFLATVMTVDVYFNDSASTRAALLAAKHAGERFSAKMDELMRPILPRG